MKLLCRVILLLADLSILHAAEAPKGYRVQELKATGGEILMPTNWQFNSHGIPGGWLYTFSDKFNDDWSYLTGFRIQLVLDVKEQSGGKTPREAALAARDKFKANARKVLKECLEEDGGFFRKTCLEVMEPNPYDPKDDLHVIYSFFWKDETDTMAISIFGAPESQWADASKIYDMMTGFTLIDMAKMEKMAAQPTPTPEPIDRKALLGRWRFDDTKGTIDEMTNREDGTFSGTLARYGKILVETEGKWALDGRALHSEYVKSSTPKIPVGTQDTDIIQEVTDDHIDLLSEEGAMRRYHRVKTD